METKIINNNPKIVPQDIIDILKGIYDPEITDYSIYDMGLIYEVNIDNSNLKIVMTLTSVNCPEAQTIPETVKREMESKFPDLFTFVDVVFEPLWSVDNMSDEIQLKLGLL